MGNKKEFDEIYSRLRDNEGTVISQGKDIKTILDNLIMFKESFERHDEQEMKKYDQTDNDIQKVNNTMIELKNSIDNIDKSVTSQADKLQDIEKAQKRYKEETDKKIAEQSSKVNKILGAICLAGFLITSIWQVYTYFDQKSLDEKKAYEEQLHKLELKLQKQENYTNRNYGLLKGKGFDK